MDRLAPLSMNCQLASPGLMARVSLHLYCQPSGTPAPSFPTRSTPPGSGGTPPWTRPTACPDMSTRTPSDIAHGTDPDHVLRWDIRAMRFVSCSMFVGAL